MSASKNRLRWAQLPRPIQASICALVGGEVVAAENCPGGFSPGLAARLRLADGSRRFVKAIDGGQWPSQVRMYRAEMQVAGALPPAAPAPRFLGSLDDGRWTILAFECIDGREPSQPWRPADLERVVRAARDLAAVPAPSDLPADHQRLGGWTDLAASRVRRSLLAESVPWAAARLNLLIELETAGLAAARGSSLVHFDLFAHNILLTDSGVLFVDWPYARPGAVFVDVVMLLASAAADGIDPEPFLRASGLADQASAFAIDGLLAAHAGACLTVALRSPEPGLEPIYSAKRALGEAALTWLRHRLER
jgi:Phosphotransferase enzyme family